MKPGDVVYVRMVKDNGGLGNEWQRAVLTKTHTMVPVSWWADFDDRVGPIVVYMHLDDVLTPEQYTTMLLVQ